MTGKPSDVNQPATAGAVSKGVIFAGYLGGGTIKDCGLADLGTAEDKPPYWAHLDRSESDAQNWLVRESGLPSAALHAILAEETRPRLESFDGGGLLLILRGVNLNPGADPEDMITLRIWAEEKRVISLRRFRIMAVQDVRDQLEKGQGPSTIGGVVTQVIGGLLQRMEPTIQSLQEAIDDVEVETLEEETPDIRQKLYGLRTQIVRLRRYVAPQRDALKQLLEGPPSWFSKDDRNRLRHALDQVTRYVEALEAARDRTAVVQDEMANRIGEMANRRIYLLSIVAGIFLPLGLLTGLLGINVAGMPGAETPWAFWAVCGLLGVLVVFEIWLFKRLNWV
ncbi:zinc transporter ZntB [Limibacillus halophilus]|uniref:Zinc transporter n=1 Tax=Limibacillus halophilus TaxID=1579333 RepID=A0A839SZ17_9PROT|nr:zinc transporter ZntB [Limibacillus halophilus]MBB3066854.1 zinc transporter [Limibacillus halophilus]